MDLDPQKFRELVFQLLFALDAGGGEEQELVSFMMHALSISKKHVRAALEKTYLIWNERDALDRRIAETSQEYAFERIKKVEKNVLRCALYELLIEQRLSAKIIISEAHRLVRKFGTPEGASFVNALLDDPSLIPQQQMHEQPVTLPA